MPTKTEIVESLYKIMCSATSTAGDSRVENNDYFKRRVLGFKAEIEFENLLEKSRVRFLEGGQLISKKLSGDEEDQNSFIYTTISYEKPEGYTGIYKTLAAWDEVSKLIYIQIGESWAYEPFETKLTRESERQNDTILRPPYIFFVFNRESNLFEKSDDASFGVVLNNFPTSERRPNLYPLRKREQFEYFNEYDEIMLKKIYATRYFLDVILRKAQGRQIIDLDGFLEVENKRILVEIKEKSPITNDVLDKEEWRYGWDSRRILWYLYLLNKINLPVLYNVRRIDNRTDRNFVQWDSIFLSKFLTGVSWSSSRGGGGGEDTLLAPYTFFRRLEEILESLL